MRVLDLAENQHDVYVGGRQMTVFHVQGEELVMGDRLMEYKLIDQELEGLGPFRLMGYSRIKDENTGWERRPLEIVVFGPGIKNSLN